MIHRLRNLFLKGFLRHVKGDRAFSRIFNFMNAILGKPSSTVFTTEGLCMIATSTATGCSVAFARPSRGHLYYRSVESRLQTLFESYCLSNIQFRKSDVVIDCGANVGELGLCLKNAGVVYIAVEPSAREFVCLQRNIEGIGTCINAALWKERATLPFYDGNDHGDSSVFEISTFLSKTTVPALTLQDIWEDNNLDRVRLLKLEAEGAEPEILAGGKKILQLIDYIAVDCGFERGLKQESTLREVLDILYGNSFSLIDFNYDRMSFLFANKAV